MKYSSGSEVGLIEIVLLYKIRIYSVLQVSIPNEAHKKQQNIFLSYTSEQTVLRLCMVLSPHTLFIELLYI